MKQGDEMDHRSTTKAGCAARLKSVAALLFGILAIQGPAVADLVYNPVPGWNLLGNSSGQTIDASVYFSDSTKVTSVWKWSSSQHKWAFYSPSLSSAALASLAQTNGYLILNQINPKDGFWVNAAKSFSVVVPSSGTLTLSDSDLFSGWNLVASADNKTPSQLNQALSASLSTAGKAPNSYWSWSASAGKWRFLAPSLEISGGLDTYIASNSYLAFSAPLAGTEGLWVNVSGGTPITSLFAQASNPINLKLTPDVASKAVSALVPAVGGGTLKTMATDGTGFELNIPAGALIADTQITMTPISAISNLPLNGLGGAVKLEPEGLAFYKDVTLTVTPKVAIPVANQVLFGFSASGEDMILATPSKPYGSAIQLSFQHFSGGGVGNGVSGQKAAILNSIANRSESRLASEIGAALADARADALNGGTGQTAMDKLIALMAEYEDSVVKNRMNAAMAASASCGDTTKASQTLLGYERQRQLLGLPQSSAYGQLQSLLTSGNAKCREEKIAECKAKTEPGILKAFDYGVARQQALLGVSGGSSAIYSDAYYDETCGKNEIWVGTTTLVSKDTASFSNHERHITASATFERDTSGTPQIAGNKVFKVRSGTMFNTIPPWTFGKCSMGGGSGSIPLLPQDGYLEIDPVNLTYFGWGYGSSTDNHTFGETQVCPPPTGSTTVTGRLDFDWFRMPGQFLPIDAGGNSFSGTDVWVGPAVTITSTWTFTKQ
jgi:hypothetical protein